MPLYKQLQGTSLSEAPTQAVLPCPVAPTSALTISDLPLAPIILLPLRVPLLCTSGPSAQSASPTTPPFHMNHTTTSFTPTYTTHQFSLHLHAPAFHCAHTPSFSHTHNTVSLLHTILILHSPFTRTHTTPIPPLSHTPTTLPFVHTYTTAPPRVHTYTHAYHIYRTGRSQIPARLHKCIHAP